jgi:hypothetical protein
MARRGARVLRRRTATGGVVAQATGVAVGKEVPEHEQPAGTRRPPRCPTTRKIAIGTSVIRSAF